MLICPGDWMGLGQAVGHVQRLSVLGPTEALGVLHRVQEYGGEKEKC